MAAPFVARALLLDMDGLMVDSEPLWFEVERAFAARRGAEWTRELWAQCVGRGLANTLETMAARFGLDIDSVSGGAELVDTFIARVGELALKPGCRSLIDAARAAEVPLALASSSARRLVLAVLRRFDLEPSFAAVVSGDDVSSPKPAPDIFLRAAARLAVPPAACVVLEDSPAGVKAGLAAGMTVIAVPDGAHTDPSALSGANVVVRDLVEAQMWLSLVPPLVPRRR